MPSCKQCNQSFEITDDDRVFYKKVDVPEPKLCPDCRMQRRMTFRNERKLCQRKCDITGKSIISVYDPDSPVKICEKDYWFSDKFDPMSFGRDYDFSSPFFEQFKSLMLEIPFPSLRVERSENCDYNTDMSDCSNCYLCSRTHMCQDMLYTYRGNRSSSCVDCYQIVKSEHLYECVECVGSYNSKFLFFCSQCSDSAFLIDCRNCTDCFMSTNLRNKKYCFLNEQLTKEEYSKKLSEFDFNSYHHVQKAFELFKQIKGKAIHRDLIMVNTEDSTGDNLFDCKRCNMCFDVKFSEDCSYAWNIMDYKDSMDAYSGGRNSELCYDVTSTTASYNCSFCVRVTNSSNVSYSMFCKSCENCFGCIGLRHKKFCIFNKEYSEEEYNEIIPKIIEYMKSTGEYGEFFPVSLSPFAYNDTVASEYFPLDKNKVVSNGWRWKDEETEIPDVTKVIPADKLPDNINDIPDDVLNWAIKCAVTGRPYKIVPQELKFYRSHNLPIPHLHPDERHKNRLFFKRPPRLFERTCSKCDIDVKSSYSSDRPEQVYCEKCYLNEIH